MSEFAIANTVDAAGEPLGILQREPVSGLQGFEVAGLDGGEDFAAPVGGAEVALHMRDHVGAVVHLGHAQAHAQLDFRFDVAAVEERLHDVRKGGGNAGHRGHGAQVVGDVAGCQRVEAFNPIEGFSGFWRKRDPRGGGDSLSRLILKI